MSKSKKRTTLAAAKAAIPVGELAQMRRPPTHPGEIFEKEFLEPVSAKISQAKAARRLRWSANRMNAFVRGQRGVTAENAVMLSALTGTSAEFWMQLQLNYDLWHALKKVGRPEVTPLSEEPAAK